MARSSAGRAGKPATKSRGRAKRATHKAPSAQAIAYERALEALHLMRAKGLSLKRAAGEAHTTSRTVVRHVGRALTRGAGGRYQATPSDRLARTLKFLTPKGQIALTVRSSRTASRIAKYWAAVDHYLKTGRTDALREFRRDAIRVEKVAYPFITDPKTLARLGYAGEVSFEDLYALAS